MKRSSALIILSVLVAILMLASSAMALLHREEGASLSFSTSRGEKVQLYGGGFYKFETVRDATGNRGTDMYVLVVAVPLLVLSTVLYWRGSFKGGILLTGMLAYFLYLSASMTFGYAYNNLFLLYLAAFSASFFATILAVTRFELSALPSHFSTRMPYRGMAIFLFAVGISLILVWAGLDILPALIGGSSPALTGHTTLPTHALDMGVVAPLAILAALMLLRRLPLGYLLASILLLVSAVLGAGVLALSLAQIASQVLTVAETLAFVVPFVVLTLFALVFTIRLFRNISEHPVATQL